jgi:hypothetical protein
LCCLKFEPEDILHALVREDRREKLLRALEGPPKGDPAAKDDMPVSRSLEQALASAANIAQERDSRTIAPPRS